MSARLSSTRPAIRTTSSVDAFRAYLAGAHPGLIALDASQALAQPLLALFPADGRAQALYVVDPLGNLMMRYDARLPPKGLLEDLKRLLQLSHIG